MARLRYALLLLAALGAGCAAGGPGPGTDPGTPEDTTYLQGITSDYSIQLAEMPNHQALGPDTALRQGLIAGDDEIHVAVAAFRQDTHYALDVIVNNRTDGPLSLQRSDVRLVDAEGRWLEPVRDFAGAERMGLRGRSARRTSTFPYDGLGLYDQAQGTESLAYSSGGASSKGGSAELQGGSSATAPRGLVNFDWETTSPQAPERLEVPGRAGRAWWAYWRAAEPPTFPVTAFVTVEGKHMIFLFEE